MSYIEDQPDGAWKGFLKDVRKCLDVEDHTWAGDELDRAMKRRDSILDLCYQTGRTPKETAELVFRDLDALD